MLDEEHEKQIYLRENILDKGYDGEEFAAFLTSKKGDDGEEEVDLDNWSLDELKAVVQEFIYYQTQKKNNPKNNIKTNYNIYPNVINNMILNNNININFNNDGNDFENSQEQKQSLPLNFPKFNNSNDNSNINSNNNSINNSTNNSINKSINNYDINKSINNYDINNAYNNAYNNANNNYISTNNSSNIKNDLYGIADNVNINCLIQEKSELSKYQNVKIEIFLGEKMPGSFFSKAYQTYVVSIPLLNLRVVRKYSDFQWFRQALINLFPGKIIPPIPTKNKKGGDRFKEKYLSKRIRNLEKFFVLLLKDETIKTSQIFYDFVSIDEAKAFNDKKKSYNTMKLPQELKDYKSLNGKLEVKLDEEREERFQDIKRQIDNKQELLLKLNKQIKLLNNELTIVVNRLNELSKCCKELFINSDKYNENDKIKITYYELSDMFKLWSNALKDQNTVIYVDIREYFKYSKNTLKSMKDLVNTVEICKHNYNKSKRNLIARKEDIYKKGDINKWELPPDNKNINTTDKNAVLSNMLYNETNVVNNLKNIYGYYLNSINNEYSRLEKIFGYSHNESLVEDAKKEINIISELFKNISDITMGSKKYSMININKQIEQENNNEIK